MVELPENSYKFEIALAQMLVGDHGNGDNVIKTI